MQRGALSPKPARSPSEESRRARKSRDCEAGAGRGTGEALTCETFPATKPRMPVEFPPCPHLPTPRTGLDWQALHLHRGSGRGAEFYFACLEYGHALWQRGFAARSLLCLDRALGADLRGDEPILREWPLPYAAMAWLIARTPEGVFLGNPRVHFQHYADRLGEPRRDQRRWRAWACWALTRAVRPDLPADPKHAVVEPPLEAIATALARHGHPGEVGLWREVLASVSAANAKSGQFAP